MAFNEILYTQILNCAFEFFKSIFVLHISKDIFTLIEVPL